MYEEYNRGTGDVSNKRDSVKILKRVRRELAYLGIRFIVVLFQYCPNFMVSTVSKVLSQVAFFFWRGTNRIILKNMMMVFRGMDEKELKPAIREVYKNIVIGSVEVIKAYRRFPNDFHIEVEGYEHLVYSLNKKGKVICVSAHYGNWELLPLFLAMKGHKIAVIVRRVYDERLNRMLENFRRRYGIEIVYREKGEKIKLLKAFRRYELLGFLVDQRMKDVESINSTFLGIPSLTTVGFALLSKRYDIPVVVGVDRREKPFYHRILISEPLYPEGKDEKEIIDEVNKILSNFILASPWQWVWFHKRW